MTGHEEILQRKNIIFKTFSFHLDQDILVICQLKLILLFRPLVNSGERQM